MEIYSSEHYVTFSSKILKNPGPQNQQDIKNYWMFGC